MEIMVEVKKLETGAEAITLTRANGERIEVVTNGHVQLVGREENNVEARYHFHWEDNQDPRGDGTDSAGD